MFKPAHNLESILPKGKLYYARGRMNLYTDIDISDAHTAATESHWNCIQVQGTLYPINYTAFKSPLW